MSPQAENSLHDSTLSEFVPNFKSRRFFTLHASSTFSPRNLIGDYSDKFSVSKFYLKRIWIWFPTQWQKKTSKNTCVRSWKVKISKKYFERGEKKIRGNIARRWNNIGKLLNLETFKGKRKNLFGRLKWFRLRSLNSVASLLKFIQRKVQFSLSIPSLQSIQVRPWHSCSTRMDQMLIKKEERWEGLKGIPTPSKRKKFHVYLCTMDKQTNKVSFLPEWKRTLKLITLHERVCRI